jgi:hypothetical protein
MGFSLLVVLIMLLLGGLPGRVHAFHMNPGIRPRQQQKGSAMSTMYPLAVVSAGSITHLARTTLCHYSISAYFATIKRNEGAMMLGGKARDAGAKDLITQLTANLHGTRSKESQRTDEPAAKEHSY